MVADVFVSLNSERLDLKRLQDLIELLLLQGLLFQQPISDGFQSFLVSG